METSGCETSVPTTASSDPCYDYNTIDETWRDIRDYQNLEHDDTTVEWNGWYRLYLNGESAQMSEWCVTHMGCGGETALYLNGSHPSLEDGVVTREVLGNYMSYYNQCDQFRSNPIQVKACPGDYYVYELITPDVSLNKPSYCAVALSRIINDPCYNYESLDRPWRATTESGLQICDDDFSWNGWYRLYHYGMNIQMPESCVNYTSCNAEVGLSLNGHHPRIEDGVVTREVCGSSNWDRCCDLKPEPIRVKACPGDYYVYELVKPRNWCSGYCTDVSTVKQTVSTTNPPMITGSSFTMSDPCSNYNILDNPWRSTRNYWSLDKHDDTLVKWDGWYRLFINGSSAQMPDWNGFIFLCGGFNSLWLGGSHPKVEDGVVTCEVYSSWPGFNYTSNPIQVKACTGDYYVYKLTRPNVAIPAPVYCAATFSTPSVDPCDNYTSLDEPWRSTNNSYNNYYNYYMCDHNLLNGWYRLFLNGQSAQMPESCVSWGMCGSYYPLFLKDPHPQLEDGVVTRRVCWSFEIGCCDYESHAIQVKACPGNYYVYEFVRTLDCTAYCAEVTSNNALTPITQTAETLPTEYITPPIESITPSMGSITPAMGSITRPTTTTVPTDPCPSLNCTEDEWCGEMNGVYGCFCQNIPTRYDPDSFDFFETCESSTGSISISRCQLFEAGFSAHGLHLNDPRCRGITQNGRVEFSFDNDEHTCGTNLMANGTHIIYENFILGAPESSEGLISRERNLQISFSCVYPQNQTLSMIEINPLESRVHKTLPTGHGMYQVRMIPYHDVGFSQPFNGSVNAKLNQEIFVEVRVDGVDSRQLVTVIDTCWATPVNDPDYSLRWDLITGECPNPHDNTVKLLQNGVSTFSRFSFRMFIFNSNSTKVYLHCSVHLCLLASNHGTTSCVSGYQQRVDRSLDFHDSSSISMGPLIGSDGNTDISDRMKIKSVASCLCSSLMMLLVSLMSFLVFL
nr:uncharacterized protein LOC129420667 [Misgurnus anguillicaudatus]